IVGGHREISFVSIRFYFQCPAFTNERCNFFLQEPPAENVASHVFDCLFLTLYVAIILRIVSGIPLQLPELMTRMLSLYDFPTLIIC
ncbi:hypothetical protein, partial [Klebsiella aerogenes]|uniref:hypothetical protein n=1 Tax=Klebsiella aerogenes TaxID=548 RepID=UPI001954F15C